MTANDVPLRAELSRFDSSRVELSGVELLRMGANF